MLNLTLVMTTVRQVYLWVTNYNPSEKIPLSSYDKESEHIRYPPPPSPSFAPQCRTIFTSEHSTASVVWYPYDVFRPFSCTERRHFGWTGGNISTIKTRTIKKNLLYLGRPSEPKFDRETLAVAKRAERFRPRPRCGSIHQPSTIYHLPTPLH